MNLLLAQIAACQNAALPGQRLYFHLGAEKVGFMKPDLAEALAALTPDVTIEAGRVVLREASAGALHGLARALAEQRYFRFRNEAFDVRRDGDGAVLAQIDRGALPAFGIRAEGVHVNGLVQRDGEWHVWVARRAANKLLDPGKLDHIVAGGVASGHSVIETLVKEAGEEAAIPPALALQAKPVGIVEYAMERAEGLRRDRLHCFDLILPEDFSPHPADGEVEAFELWPLQRAYDVLATGENFKFNVALVMIDLLLRTGLIDAHSDEGMQLRAALARGSRVPVAGAGEA